MSFLPSPRLEAKRATNLLNDSLDLLSLKELGVAVDDRLEGPGNSSVLSNGVSVDFSHVRAEKKGKRGIVRTRTLRERNRRRLRKTYLSTALKNHQ